MISRHMWRRFAALCLTMCALTPRPAPAQVDETALKAAFIYNFAMFTTWSNGTQEGLSFNVCVESDSPLRAALMELSGKLVDRRSWTIKIMPPASHASVCQIVVYSPMEEGLPSDLAAAIQGRSVLLVTDAGQPVSNEAVITLVLEGEHLRFDVDLDAANQRGVSLSSNLLRLARNVL